MLDKEDIKEFFRKPQEKFYFIVDRFELPRAAFSQVWYCNMYMYHRIILINHMDMFSINPIQVKERVNKAFAAAVKHKNSNYYIQEQLRTKPIATDFFNLVQKVLITNPDKWRDLQEEKVFKEFDEGKYNRERIYQTKLEKSFNDFHLETNLSSEIIHIKTQNIVKFNEVLKKLHVIMKEI
jgi:hypothetical protein